MRDRIAAVGGRATISSTGQSRNVNIRKARGPVTKTTRCRLDGWEARAGPVFVLAAYLGVWDARLARGAIVHHCSARLSMRSLVRAERLTATPVRGELVRWADCGGRAVRIASPFSGEAPSAPSR
jgi:hypothetical protein